MRASADINFSLFISILAVTLAAVTPGSALFAEDFYGAPVSYPLPILSWDQFKAAAQGQTPVALYRDMVPGQPNEVAYFRAMREAGATNPIRMAAQNLACDRGFDQPVNPWNFGAKTGLNYNLAAVRQASKNGQPMVWGKGLDVTGPGLAFAKSSPGINLPQGTPSVYSLEADAAVLSGQRIAGYVRSPQNGELLPFTTNSPRQSASELLQVGTSRCSPTPKECALPTPAPSALAKWGAGAAGAARLLPYVSEILEASGYAGLASGAGNAAFGARFGTSIAGAAGTAAFPLTVLGAGGYVIFAGESETVSARKIRLHKESSQRYADEEMMGKVKELDIDALVQCRRNSKANAASAYGGK